MTTPTLPFSKEFDTSSCYESRSYKEALARLNLMIQNRYLGVLTGEVGGGKSTLIRRLFAGLDDMTYAPIYLCKAGLKPRDFYGAMLSHMGVEPCYNVGRQGSNGKKPCKHEPHREIACWLSSSMKPMR
jgi:type II secretory pathway predicted ATPase ExeA